MQLQLTARPPVRCCLQQIAAVKAEKAPKLTFPGCGPRRSTARARTHCDVSCKLSRSASGAVFTQATGAAGADRSLDTAVDGGGGGVTRNNGSGGGGNDDSGSHGGHGGGPESLLLALGRSLDTLPTDIANGIKNGTVSSELLKKYLDLEKNVILKFFLRFAGMRERLLGDPGFPVKLSIELGIGITMKLLAEFNKRGDNFSNELDFVFANVVMAIIADTMLVWLPAPRAILSSQSSSKQRSALQQWLKNCPDNAFQMVSPGKTPYTVAQRGGAILRNGGKLLAVGFGSSLFGVGLTNALTAVRAMLDPSFKPLNKPQGVLVTSAAYGSFMALSSNLRYQFIAGILEERGIEQIFKGNSNICHLLSLAVRTGNTFLGSSQWIDYLRLIGLQK